jgi:hypothetical protein
MLLMRGHESPNLRMRPSGRCSNLQSQVEGLIDLLLARHERGARQKVIATIASLPPGQVPVRRQPRLKQGLIQAAILDTLKDAGGILSVREIRAGAERRLGRKVSPDTLWCFMSAAASDSAGPVVRCKRGLYRYKA